MTLKEALEKYEATYLKEVITQSKSLQEAWVKLGLSRVTLYHKRKKYNLLDVEPGSSLLMPITPDWLVDQGGVKKGTGIAFEQKNLIFYYQGPHWSIRFIGTGSLIKRASTRAQALEKLERKV